MRKRCQSHPPKHMEDLVTIILILALIVLVIILVLVGYCLMKNDFTILNTVGVWCNSSTTVSKTVGRGASPLAPAILL